MQRVNDKAVVFLPWDTIEAEAQKQILNTASMPFVFKHVAVMPDCHYGKGATVGTVLPTKGAIIPAAVGVDIGCGMIAVRTPLTRADLRSTAALRAGIERRIPMSAGKNNAKITATAAERVQTSQQLATDTGATPDQYDKNWQLALGTLGGGNHFIELAEDADGAVWLTLHSGSRGVGNKIGNHYIKLAQELCRKMRFALPDRDLAYLAEDHPAFARLPARPELGAAVRAAQSQRDDGPRADRSQCRRVRRRSGTSRSSSCSASTRITTSRSRSSTSASDVWVTRKGAIKATRGATGR